MKIEIPTESLGGRSANVNELLFVTQAAWSYEGMIELDFSGCTFLSAEAVVILAGLVYLRREMQFATTILMDTMTPGVKTNLHKMGFLQLFGVQQFTSSSNSLPLFHQTTYEPDALIEYFDRELMSRSEMPAMSKTLAKEIRRSLVEIFGNVFYHSASLIGGLVCGQIYPKIKEIQLTFFDTGIGISRKVRSCVPSIGHDTQAICWALERGTSTLAKSTGHPRGLGLYLVREFLKVNEGELQMCSNAGYFSEKSGQGKSSSIDLPLNGTLIDLRIKIRGGVRYKFIEE